MILLFVQRLSVRVNVMLGMLSGVVVVLLTAIIAVDVAGRYLFSKPLPGSLEMAEASLVVIVFLGLAYIQIKKGNIRILVLLEHVSNEWRKVLDIFALAIGIILLSLIAWQNFLFALRSYAIYEVRLAFPLPLYPIKFILFLGCVLLCIQYIIEIFVKLSGKGKSPKR